MSSPKATLRHHLIALGRDAARQRRTKSSSRVLGLLMPLLGGDGAILSFQSLPSEPDLHEVNSWLALSGRLRLELPHEHKMLMTQPTWTVYQEGEPLEAILVPGVGFTLKGDRLGRGAGHYDRLLARAAPCQRIGVCWQEQLLEEIPLDPWDQPVSLVIPI